MPEKVWVKPAAGKTVPDPRMEDKFPAEGREVFRDNYIERRIRDGSLIVMDGPPVTTVAQPAATTKAGKGR